MKKSICWLKLFVLFIGLILIFGCGQPTGGGGGDQGKNPAIDATTLFNITGATAIAAASSSTVSGSAVKTLTAANVTELLKLEASGQISSVFSSTFGTQWHPPISLIETGPDGSLYVGFQWGIWITSTVGASKESEVSFFKIKTDGTVEIVDEGIKGVGTWYGGSENGELPVKQLQFDTAGNLYYIGKTSAGNSILRKKATDGTFTQIGSSNYEVRDFLVTPDSFVLFHGSNVGNWSIEWLRIYSGTNDLKTIFYNDGSGYLRAYYYYAYGGTNYVFLIGTNLTLLDENSVPKKYSGIIRVTLSSTGAPAAVTALYDDNNMYNDTYTTVGSQLTWGYWDPTEMTQKKFFATDNYGQTTLPLVLGSGVTEASIRSFIRQKYQSITEDSLDDITFAGRTTTEAWQLNTYLDDLVEQNISGKTWSKWKDENGLNGVRFGNAKQLVFTSSGRLYAVMRLDDWGTGTSKGDKLFQIVNASNVAEISGFQQDTVNYYKSMSKVKAYGDYVVYLSNKVGNYKIYRLDINNPSAAPVDMLPSLTNVEIFNFDYDSATGMLYYDVYDLSNNTSYLAQQALTSTTQTSQVSAGGYTITDVVPFTSIH